MMSCVGAVLLNYSEAPLNKTIVGGGEFTATPVLVNLISLKLRVC